MALYRHVRGKDDLLDGLGEVIVRQIDRPYSDDGWKTALRQQAIAARRVMLRYQWAGRVLEERGTGGHATMACVESILAILHDSGFSIEVAHHALHVLSSRIFRFAQDLFEEPGPPNPHPIRP
jgi:hypothetical protein